MLCVLEGRNYPETIFEFLNLGKQPRTNEVLKTFDTPNLRTNPPDATLIFEKVGAWRTGGLG